MTHTPENITAEQRAEAFKLIHFAISDPGAFLKRDHDEEKGYESVTHWGTRAVVAAFDVHPLLEIRRYHPTVSAYEAADKAVWKHRKRADEAEAEVERLRGQLAVVEKFAAARAEYIVAINNCPPDNGPDYWRWQGHAEARRQLSQELGLPVAWPAGYKQPEEGDRA